VGQKYVVLPGYTVSLPDYRFVKSGEIFEPPPQVLMTQSWKIMPVKEYEEEVARAAQAPPVVVPTWPPKVAGRVFVPRSTPLSDDLEDGAYAGRRGFVLGGGPSLRDLDVEKLFPEVTIGVNRAFELLDPTIIFSMDSRFYMWLKSERYGPEVRAMFEASQARKVWVDTHGYQFGPEVRTVFPLMEDVEENGKPAVPSIEKGFTQGLKTGLYLGRPSGANSGLAALSLAVVLGLNPIYLLGFDLHSQGRLQTWFHDGHPLVVRDEIHLAYLREFQDYGEWLASHGVEVINLNPKSALQTFPFSTLDQVPPDQEVRPLFVAYHTGGHYRELAGSLMASLHQFALDYHVEEVPDRGSWDRNTKYKPEFILSMLDMFPGRPLVYIDVDARVRANPALFFGKPSCDLMVHYKDGQELLSGTIYLAPTKRTRKLVQAWKARTIVDGPQVWEQKSLAAVIGQVKGLKVGELPPQYCQIFDSMAVHGRPVIEHYQASRMTRRAREAG
jgi:hypothetical protein